MGDPSQQRSLRGRRPNFPAGAMARGQRGAGSLDGKIDASFRGGEPSVSWKEYQCEGDVQIGA